MTDNIIKIIEAFKDDILTFARIILEDGNVSTNRKTGKNTLKDSRLKADINTQIANIDNPVIIEALFPEYVTYIEWNRPKKYGKQPPLSSLRDWALSRGIPADNNTLFVIARAIWRDGHEGRPIIATLEKEVDESFDKETGDKLINAIIEDLIKFFN